MKTVSALLLAILCFGCGGYSAPKAAPAQAGIVPTIAAILPNAANHGDPAFTLTVNGSTFNNNAVVSWNGMAQTTVHPAANQLTVAIPAAAITDAGSAAVTVTNPGSSTSGGPYGGGTSTKSETSNSMTFKIN
jgi:hypothetical protein